MDVLSTSAGKVGVVYGFLRQFCSLLKAHRSRLASLVTVVWDSGRSTARTALFPAYKANRDAARQAQGFDTESFETQRLKLQDLLSQLGVRQVKLPGVEADDLIGITIDLIGRQYQEVCVVTGDKDLWQLLTNNVTVYEPINERFIDRLKAKEDMGIEPELIPSLKALTGDSDNIPGAPGIGPKIAVQLLTKFGSLSRMFDALAANDPIEGIKGFGKKKQKALLDAKDDVALYFKLTNILAWSELPESDRNSLWQQLTCEISDSDFNAFRLSLEALQFNSIVHDPKLIGVLEEAFNVTGYVGRPDTVPVVRIDGPKTILNIIDNKPPCFDLEKNCTPCQESVNATAPQASWQDACIVGQAWRAQGWLPGPTTAVVTASLGDAAGADHFQTLRRNVLACTKCSLRKECKGPVFSAGLPGAKVMVIARNPGATEDGNGIPLSGKAGKRFNQLLAGQDMDGSPIKRPDDTPIGNIIEREKCYITNTAKCFSTANRPPTDAEILSCLPYLREEISIVKPSVILTLGSEAMAAVTGGDSSIMQVAGTTMLGKDCAGAVQYSVSSGERTWDPVVPDDCVVVVGNHPSHALRTQSANLKFIEVTKVFSKAVQGL